MLQQYVQLDRKMFTSSCVEFVSFIILVILFISDSLVEIY